MGCPAFDGRKLRQSVHIDSGLDDVAVSGLQLNVGALPGQRANFTLRMRALASLLSVFFEQQVGPLPGLEGLGKPGV